MTLDPVHFDGIAALARRITQHVDEQDHRDAAETVWQEFLDPLHHDGDVVLVKGSRGVGLDHTVDRLVGREAA